MFDFLFNPKGRISRKGWWLGFTLPYVALTVGTALLAGLSPILGLVNFLVGLFFLWPSIVAVPVKRFHDLGTTGFWQLGFVIAEIVLTIVFFIGIGVYAAAEGLDDELASLGTLPQDEQGAAFIEIVGGSFSNPVVVAATVMLVLLNLAWLYFQGIKRGQVGENKHGGDPLASGRGFAD